MSVIRLRSLMLMCFWFRLMGVRSILLIVSLHETDYSFAGILGLAGFT